jgi:hypothetical protein
MCRDHDTDQHALADGVLVKSKVHFTVVFRCHQKFPFRPARGITVGQFGRIDEIARALVDNTDALRALRALRFATNQRACSGRRTADEVFTGAADFPMFILVMIEYFSIQLHQMTTILHLY